MVRHRSKIAKEALAARLVPGRSACKMAEF